MPPAMTPPPSAPTASSDNRTLIICGVFALVAIGIIALFALGVLARSIYSRLVLEKEPDLECTLIDVESAQKMILAHNDLIRTPEPVFQHHRTEMYREIYRPGPPQKIVLDDIREPIYPKVFSAFPGTEVPVNVAPAPEVGQSKSVMEGNTALGQETISAADTTGEIAISQGENSAPILSHTKAEDFPNSSGPTVLGPVGNSKLKFWGNRRPSGHNLKNNSRDRPSHSGKENRPVPSSRGRRIA